MVGLSDVPSGGWREVYRWAHVDPDGHEEKYANHADDPDETGEAPLVRDRPVPTPENQQR